MNESQEHVFETSSADRSSVMGMTIYTPIALVVLAAFGFYKIHSRGPTHEARDLIGFFAGITLVAVILGFQFMTNKRMGLYRGRLRVTNEYITWESPGSRTVTGYWTELKYVKPLQNLLYFEDGTCLPLEFGRNKYGELKKESLSQIIQLSGPHPLLRDAYAEKDRVVSPPKSVKVPIQGGVLASIAIGSWTMAKSRIWGWTEMELNTAIFLIIALGVSPFFAFRIPRTRRIAKRYHPPRAEARRYKLPWS
jgi:hypothetical protein